MISGTLSSELAMIGSDPDPLCSNECGLSGVFVSSNQIGGTIPLAFAQVPLLKELHLDHNVRVY